MISGLLYQVVYLQRYRIISLTSALIVFQAHVQRVPTERTTMTETRARSALPVHVAIAAAAGPARQRVGHVGLVHGMMTGTHQRRVLPAQTVRHVAVGLVLLPAASLATKLVVCRACYRQ